LTPKSLQLYDTSFYSDCDTEFQDCIQDDELYLEQKIGFYRKNGFSGRCLKNQEKCSVSPYPGCDLSEENTYPSLGYNPYLSYHRYRRQTSQHCGGDGQCGVPVTRAMRADRGKMLIRRDYFKDRRNLSYQDLDEDSIRRYEIEDERELNNNFP